MKRFVTFEGIDGSGKSTVSRKVYEVLRKRGYDVIYTFEPTDGEIGKCVKRLMEQKINPLTISLLFTADRYEHVKLIKNWLDEGKIIICDRYVDSTYAYQSVQLEDLMEDPMQWLEMISSFVIKPDRTFLFDLEVEEALTRIRDRKLSTLEERQFLEKVRRKYLEIARESRFKILDARKNVEDLVKECMEDILENDRS